MDAALQHLLSGDPAVRWQVLRDLTGAPAVEVEAERARVLTEGWGARLLAAQRPDGTWDGGAYRPDWVPRDRAGFDVWSATHPVLELLRIFGADPSAPAVRQAVERVRDGVRWEYDGSAYFDGEVEPCINGGALANAVWFEVPAHRIVATLLETRLPDGGWNCWDEDGTSPSSFHSTICAVEGLLAWEQAGGVDPAVSEARRTGEEHLLERHLLRRRSTGEVIDPRFAMPSFPTRWYYDVLRALDHFRTARPERDGRCAEAVELIRGKRLPNGLWKLENTHEGAVQFPLEEEHEGFPSRWITLRAMRVLRWWDGQSTPSSQEADPASSVSTP